jgi:hypothetical protein
MPTSLIILALFPVILHCQAASSAGPKFGPKWNVLLGEWKSEPGGPAGVCAFRSQLADHVIVRTNHAELSAGTPAHDDLMVISPDPSPDRARAMYYDNEGHTIEYAAEWSADGNTLTFTSKSGPGPGFRLIYKKVEAEVFSVSFEMAAPGQSGMFKPYTSGRIRRTAK